MMCLKPVWLTKNIDRTKYSDGMEVPCGKCLFCRIQKRSEWTLRCIHELQTSESAIWLTLTYADDPVELKKEDLRRFFKKLRKISNKKFKYLAVGEYGKKEGRPHYHVILYNFNINCQEDIDYIQRAWSYDNKLIGYIHFANVEKNSIQYTLKYMTKSLDADLAEQEYGSLEQPFKWQSQGIGKDYALANAEQFRELFGVPVGDRIQNIPRYYIEKCNIDKETIREISKAKKAFEIKKVLENCGFPVSLQNADQERLYKYDSKKFKKYYDRKNLQKEQKKRDLQSKLDQKKVKI